MALRQRDNKKLLALRFSILQRDNFTCQYCGQSAPSVQLVVDHVVPVALGGSDQPSNLRTACWACNVGKSDKQVSDPATCVSCWLPADTLHFVPWLDGEIVCGCPQHDPGGYWLPLREFDDDWLKHLSSKNHRPDRRLADWMERHQRGKNWTISCVHCKVRHHWHDLLVCQQCEVDICGECEPHHENVCEPEEKTVGPISAVDLEKVKIPAWYRGRSDWKSA